MRPNRLPSALPSTAAAFLIAVHIVLVVHGASRHSAVFDEVVYPTSGYAYLTTGDYRMNPEHPPLLKLLTGAAWLGTGLDVKQTPGWNEGNQWAYGRAMIHADGHARALLMRARFPVALLSAALALAIFLVAGRLAGDVAGVAAVALYAFDPLAIAHAGYATTDLGGAAFYFFAAVVLPRAFTGRSRAWIVPAGLLAGGALAAKFSNLPIVAIVGAVALAAAWTAWRRGGGSPAVREAALRAGGILAIAVLVVTATYGLAGPGLYLQGVQMLGFHSEVGHPTYAFGRYATTGWWWYFPAAWGVKTPIPILLLTLPGIVLLARGLRVEIAKGTALLLAPALILGAAVGFGLNIGVRHLLPLTPFLAVAGGQLVARVWSRGIVARAAVAGLALWLAVGTIRVHPDEMAYANEAAGGPDKLWTRLTDSNVDWGQDLPALAREIGRVPLRRVYLSYFGTADPRSYGIPYCWIASMSMIDPRCDDGPDAGGREWIAISVTNLLDVYTMTHATHAWLRERPFTAFPGRSIALFDITGDARAHASLGASSLSLGEPSAAETPLRRAVELAPESKGPRLLLASALAAQGKLHEAASHCRKASESGAAGEEAAICDMILAEVAAGDDLGPGGSPRDEDRGH